jgi:signal transduction histidine kinase
MTDAASGETSDHPQAPQPRPIRVLLVEDDEDDYVLTRDLLQEIRQQGFTLDWVARFDEAAAAIARQEHDVYLLDYMLDGRDGLELLRQPSLHRKPVIVLTGQEDRHVDIKAMKAGASDYLVKGQINAPLLERAIRYAIRHKRSEEALRHAQDELERRVQERTEQLQQKIAKEQQRAEQLKEADRRKNEFLAMLAHELRNPLAPISNALHIMSLPTADPKQQSELVHMAIHQVHHMARLLDDLLDVSRITHGKINLKQERIDLCEVIRCAIDTATPLITSQQHALRTHLPPCPIWAHGDETRLGQLVGNLLNNAAKYTAPGGDISLDAYEEGQDLVIRVKDTGIGIPPEKLPYIFNMFMQVDNSLERTQGGLGIGLMLVKNIAELHGGTITAHSDGKGKGSEFVVRLPILTPSQQALPESASAPASQPPETHRVLVVDDNEASARTLGWMVQALGYEVKTAFDAESAMQIAHSYKPDVVLLDIGMPKINGYELCKMMHSDPLLKQATFIAQTGWGQQQDKQRAKESGFNAHLTKPVSLDALQQQLRKAG